MNKYKQSNSKTKPTSTDVDDAFDSLAKFLMEQYRRKKEVLATQNKPTEV